MEQLEEEELDSIKESVKEYIRIIEVNNSEVPSSELQIVEKNEEGPGYEMTIQEVPTPSELVDDYKQIGIFDDVASELLESESYPNRQVIIGRSSEGPLPGITLEERGEDRREEDLKRMLRRVSGKVMDYNGGIEFSEEAFEAAVQGTIHPFIKTKPESNIIIPLYGMKRIDDQIELPFSKDIEVEYEISDSLKEDYNKDELKNVEVSNIEISEMTEGELTSIHNIESSPKQRSIATDLPRHKIKFSTNSIVNQNIGREIAEMVVTLLRMSDPFSRYSIGEPYVHYPGNYQIYDDVPNIRKGLVSVTNQESSSNNSIRKPEGEVSKKDVKELEERWEEISDYLPSDAISNNDMLSRPIQRFNQMYKKSRKEDAIIDCIIGLESTLIKDGGQVQERGTVLLEDDKNPSKFIYDYLGVLWSLRNEIVHTDQQITAHEVDGEDFDPDEIINYARYFLSRIILEYARLSKEHPDKNITQINQDLINSKIASRLKQES